MGEFDLAGIPPMPRGVPQIEITYDLDANGILNVSAVEKSTGKTNKITITSDKSRSKDDIERMVAEAEKYAAEDKAVIERSEAKNGAESYLYNSRNAVQDEKVKEKLSTEDIEAVETVVKEGTAWLDEHGASATVEQIKTKQKAWEDAIRPVMTKLYAAAAPGDASGPRVEEVD
jgi:L1 cell adhesion molecule like protein